MSQMITGVNFQGFSTYLSLLEDEFGWSKALLSAPRSLAQVETAILGPINGYLVDRFGPRIMITLGVFIFGLGLMLFGFVNDVWSFIAVFALMAVGSSFSSLLVVATAINNWFRRGRTLGIGLATTGLGVSGVVAIPLIVMAQEAIGWRNTAIASGLAVWAIGIPAGMLMRDRPENYGMLPDGDTPESIKLAASGRQGARNVGGETDFTVSEAFHTPSFWFLSFGLALGMFVMSAVGVHQFIQMEREVGLSRNSAALVIMVMSAFNIGGRLFGGFLGDRLSKRILLGIAMLGTGVAVLILAWSTSLAQAMTFGVIYGTVWGIRTPISNAIRGEYFGRAHYGKISGFSQGITSPFAISGPIIVGLYADIYGQYQASFYVLGVLGIIASVFLFLAVRPKAPVREPSTIQ